MQLMISDHWFLISKFDSKMKLNKITASFAAFAALAMVSCSEGQYWDEASNPAQVCAFAKPAESLSIPADGTIPSTYEVTVSRSTNGAESTVPVTFKSNSPLLTGAESVTFPAGSTSATYTINIASGVKAGLTYTAQLTLGQPEDAITHVKEENLVYTFNLSQVLVLDWQDKGTALTYSYSWVGNDDPIEIPVQEAVNWPTDGQRLMRLVSPYWYLEPEYCEEGHNIQFYLDDNGDALGMYAAYQYIGESDPDNGYFYFGCPAAYGGSFQNQGNLFVMSGVIGTAASATATTASPGWYETLAFQWSEYGK